VTYRELLCTTECVTL